LESPVWIHGGFPMLASQANTNHIWSLRFLMLRDQGIPQATWHWGHYCIILYQDGKLWRESSKWEELE
jgi:hypothetical protein